MTPCSLFRTLPPQAALAASPQPSRYDPLQALLKAEPITGSYKYCLAEVVLRGGWQQSLQEGLKDLPAWDPMANVVGARAASASPSARRPPSKYDMVGVALEGMAALPEELASGKWAEKQVRLGLRGRGRGRGEEKLLHSLILERGAGVLGGRTTDELGVRSREGLKP